MTHQRGAISPILVSQSLIAEGLSLFSGLETLAQTPKARRSTAVNSSISALAPARGIPPCKWHSLITVQIKILLEMSTSKKKEVTD